MPAAGVVPAAVSQLAEYLTSAKAALGALPTQSTVILERFFDESGGMQLVIHSPFGSRINRAWGLALRKRFCLKFNFELQAAATEDAIVLSLSTSHSFDLAGVARYLHSNSVRDVLVQAMLASPMFAARWRWIASISLALPRFRGGRKVAAPLQRMRADDLMASVFPDQAACADNIVGDREIPDHPLVRQVVDDCLHDAMDIDGFVALLRGMESGAIAVVARDMPTPSPLALEVLTARPYAYLDDAPLEERRTQAVMARRWLDPETASDLGKLDIAAIERVREEAWPVGRQWRRAARRPGRPGLPPRRRDRARHGMGGAGRQARERQARHVAHGVACAALARCGRAAAACACRACLGHHEAAHRRARRVRKDAGTRRGHRRRRALAPRRRGSGHGRARSATASAFREATSRSRLPRSPRKASP